MTGCPKHRGLATSDCSNHPTPGRVVLLMAAFNEHGYETRQAFAHYLLNHDVAVAILENPYYGLRRPGTGQPMRTAADLLKMGVGAVWDGVEVLEWLRNRRSWTVGVAGYSMGANTAALIAAVSPEPVACAAMAASPSPGPVFTVGALAPPSPGTHSEDPRPSTSSVTYSAKRQCFVSTRRRIRQPP